MGPVKFTRVVSFSSEDPNQPAENLVKDGTFRKWRCKSNGEQRAWVELQLEKSCPIQSIDIGNNGSAFVEVLVGQTGFSEDQYKVILNSSSFMTPQEARNETNLQRVRMFRAQELNKAVLSDKWDRIRVVCTQPFNQHFKYGLSFIAVHTKEDEPATTTSIQKASSTNLLSDMNLGLFKLKEVTAPDPIKQGTLFSRFKTKEWTNSSPKTTSGAIRAASQSLADAALAESEAEARNALKPSPLKADRPSINLTDKLKAVQSPLGQMTSSDRSPSVVKRILVDDSKLPSRKLVERDHKSPKSPQQIASDRIEDARRKKIKTDPISEERKNPPKVTRREEPAVTPKRKTPPRTTATQMEHERPVKKLRLTKPFNKLLDGAFVVLSGYQNPLRSQLRDKLLAMGAKYKPEWNSQCTHLVSAFLNTPKFREVKGKGKIVTKDWVEQCYTQRKRLPWRRFHLDRDDKGAESEEEIWAEDDSVDRQPTHSRSNLGFPTTPQPQPKPQSRQSESKKCPIVSRPLSPKTMVSAAVNDDLDAEDYGGSTDVDDPDTDDEIEMARTNIIKEQQKEPRLDYSHLALPQLPNMFRGFIFCIDGDFSPEIKEQIERFIKAFNGQIVADIKPMVSHVITDQKWKDAFTKVQKDNPDMKFLGPEWIWECVQSQKWVPTEKYEVMK